jgi:hypothetical protein
MNWSDTWTVVFLAHILQSQEKLALFKALQFLGDGFLGQGEIQTALSLFTVAMQGFTNLDIHRSKAECMVHLGDNSVRNGVFLEAVEHWTTARLLFERSSQPKQVTDMEERLAGITQDMQEQHSKKLVLLSSLHAPIGVVEELDVGSMNLSTKQNDSVQTSDGKEVGPVSL